jgi:penicillin amidase
MRRRLRLIALIALGVLLVAVLAAGGYGVLTVRASFPQTGGEITIAGLDAAVQVRRDEWGIPRISAETAHDLFMAQGYVHAQDRFWEMDFRRHVTAGRLSELFGASQVDTDAFIRTLGWRRVAEEELGLLSDETMSYLQDYADGVNAYLSQHSGSALSLEYAVLGLQTSGYVPEPWTPADSVAWLKAMAWDLRGNMDDEMSRVQLATVLSPQQVADIYSPYPYDEHPVIVSGDAAAGTASMPVPADATSALAATMAGIQRLEASLPALLGSGEGIGSNSFAVAGSRTASGKPILVNDPHLGPSMPGIWYQVGLDCRTRSDKCPFEVTGYSFSGVPGVIIGHNQRIAWGFTNLGPDVSDLFLEDVQGDSYRRGSQMVPLEIRSETINVAGGDPVTIQVRSTVHGPLLSDVSDRASEVGLQAPAAAAAPSGDAPAVALRWTALDPGRTMDSLFLLDAAQNFDDFRNAARSFEVPSQNMLYADVDGHIGYQAPGKIPIRANPRFPEPCPSAGCLVGDGDWPAPGWDPAYDWAGYIPFDDLPWTLDPASGFIVTANNAVVGPDYPYHLTDDWDRGYRAAR